jgi:hypothetical protein
VPAAAWLELRHAGPKFLAALDVALDRYSPDAIEVARPGSAEAVVERRVHLAKRLGPPARLRYAQFLEQLARSRIPILALDKIADALNAEAIPIADPTVTLLLDTAGEEELLGFYLQTHAPAVEDPSTALLALRT